MTIERTGPPYGEYLPVGRSELVKHILLLPISVRKLLGANDYLIAIVDSVVTLSAIVLEEGEVSLAKRLTDAGHEFAILQEPTDWITAAVHRISDSEITTWAKRLHRADRKKVLNRLLGTAKFNLVRQGLSTDTRTVLMAIRIGVSFIRPWALAMDDSLGMLTQAQKDEAGVPVSLAASLFGMALNFEELLGVALADDAGLKFPKEAEQYTLSKDEVHAAMNQFRQLVRASADENLADLSDVFSRKMRGARDALEFSVDGVSQAANSLVELIDRIAREAFTENEVFEWLRKNSLTDELYTFVTPEKKRRPTKRAQLMCLAWAGSQIDVVEPQAMNLQKVAAYALLNVRDHLQKLKHSDDNTPEERALLAGYLGTIEGTIMIMINACWITAGRKQVQALRAQFSNTP